MRIHCLKVVSIISLFATIPTINGDEAFPFFDGTDADTKVLMQNAQDRIEQVRKSDFQITLKDERGKPIRKEVVIELQRHDFDFGANLFGFEKLSDSDPAKQVSLKAIEETFNTLIVCDYWHANQKSPDAKLNWRTPDSHYEIAARLGKKPRHHALMFGYPRWFHKFETEEELWKIIEDRIKNVATRYPNIPEADVINEFVNYQYWDQNPHAKYLKSTNFPNFAIPENGERILELTRKHMPNTKLVVLETNLWNVENPVFQEIFDYHWSLIQKGVDYDYIGYQAHYYALKNVPFQKGTKEWGPRTFMMDGINRGLEQMAQLGKPIVITEFNPPSRSNKNSNPDQPRLTDEEIASWEANYYTLIFSKPYIHGLSRWFTIDNLGGRGMDAGIVTESGQLKPNYYALKNLIKEKWHTRLEAKPDKEGKIAFRGFNGTYTIKPKGREGLSLQLNRHDKTETIRF
ncbi:MAG: endo-1,4-beta-xylanase [Verrucomicrobiota bacterium]